MRLALALDESKECDDVYPVSGFEFILDKELYAQVGNIELDFASYGFTIKPEIEIATAAKDCGGCSCGT